MFILFAGDDHYPRGGMDDYRGAYNSLEDAIAAYGKLRGIDWGHIVRFLPDGRFTRVWDIGTGPIKV